ncbi:hypothetical protein MferCBS49748_006021 [Microsporum ferrugineum]
MFTYMRRDEQRPSSIAFAPSSSSTQPNNDSLAAFHDSSTARSTLTEGIFESGIWTAEPDLNSAFASGKWFSDEKIYCPGKTVPPSPEEKIVVTEYELRDNWLANDRYHSNASPMYGSTQNSPGVGQQQQPQHQQHQQQVVAAAAVAENAVRSSSTWRWTLGKGSGSSPSGSLKDGGYSPGAVGSRSSSKPSPDTSSYSGGGFLRESGNSSSKRHQQEVVEVPSSKGTKTRLNLLNPMVLLARRRSAQLVSSRPEDISISKLTVPAIPDDYDPRIRGSLVHDFSVPRARSSVAENNSNNYMADRAARSRQVRELPDNPPRQHQRQATPLSIPYRLMNRTSAELPSRPDGKQQYSQGPPPEPESKQAPPESPPKAQTGNQYPQESPPAYTKSPPSTMRYKPASVRDPSFVPLGLPRHLTSSASRFSFDLAGGASSSQEKLMEEKHKEKEAAKRAQGIEEVRSEFDDDSDEFDYDAMMDDDGLEEKIPGINADAESTTESDDGRPALRNHINPYIPTLPTVIPSPISPHSNEPLPNQQQFSNGLLPSSSGVSIPSQFTASPNQPGISMYNGGYSPFPPATVNPGPATYQGTSVSKNDEDDMYYDDGRFGELPPEMQGSHFDESIFDDETSYLYDNKRRAAAQSLQTINGHGHPLPQNSVKGMSAAQGLTKGNLEAYHSALAQAANEAARKGRFERNASLSETSLPEGESQTDPCLTTDESRMSQTVDTGMEDSFDDFDYYDGDALDDDPIIAEANADVLENDDEGFYGREFGFYAHAHGSDDTERVYGGYFGVKGAEGIIRNHSGRKNFREPSLTPITERSEWSTRNSIISLAAHAGHSNQQVSNPPLSQLVDMEVPDDEISLSALMKLRRGAWGGSNGSLRSNTGSQGAASPSTSTQPNRGSLNNYYYDTGSPVQTNGMLNGHSELNSPIQFDKEPTPDSRSNRRHSDCVRSPPAWDAVNRNSPRALQEDDKPGPLNCSAGERISYIRSRDESGSQYWVLERRRTGDSGESELLEREAMKRGRI